MGALNPLFLLAGLAVAVPIYLHLFHRHETRRLSFPALRYLERTEREHARQIRLRQILLMLARVLVLLLLVGAGARLFFGGRGASHPPTAAVLIIDNSMSSGLVVGEIRVLDELKSLAERGLASANEEDRFWVIRAGEPWLPALPGGPAEARRAIAETGVSEAAGDLTAAIGRAVRLLEASDLEHREIHLLSDLQASAFAATDAAAGTDIPIITWRRSPDGSINRALADVVVGGGLPPLEGRRTEVTVSSMASRGTADSAHVPLRLVVNERIRGAATLPAGAQTTIAMPPSGGGWVQGYADADPDDLRSDDRRYFAYRSRPAPTVAVSGTPGLFVREALTVLAEANRISTATPAQAAILISANASGLEQRSATASVLVVPPTDPTLLPAANRRLQEAGIPWSFSSTGFAGRTPLLGGDLPTPLEGVEVLQRFELTLVGDPPAPIRTLGSAGGAPWAVEGADARGRRYLVIGSPLDASGTTLPVSTGMLRFIDWVASEWAGAGGGAQRLATGDHVSAPAGATHVRFPGGEEFEIDGTRMVRGTAAAGFYTFLAADTVVSIVALNPPLSESDLSQVEQPDIARLLGDQAVEVVDADAWDREIFRARQGPELWRPFLMAVLLLLLLEGLMATSGERTPFAGTASGAD